MPKTLREMNVSHSVLDEKKILMLPSTFKCFPFYESPVENGRVIRFFFFLTALIPRNDGLQGKQACVQSCVCVLLWVQEIRTTSKLMRNLCLNLFCKMCSRLFQVQNLNNIMAFPLENVLKSELREGRLVSLHFTPVTLHNETALSCSTCWIVILSLFCFGPERLLL